MLKKLLFSLLLSITFLNLSSCEGNPGWEGPEDSSDPYVQIAEEVCECVYNELDDFEGINPDNLMEEAADWKKIMQGEKIEDEKLEEVMKLMALEKTTSEIVEGGECMETIEEKLFSQGLDFEQMMEVLDANCSLGVFYN